MVRSSKLHIKLFLLGVSILLYSCSSSLLVEKKRNNQSNAITKIVSISPDFEVITSTSSKNPRHYKLYQKIEDIFFTAIFENAQQQGIEIEIINQQKDLNVNSDFYSTFAPLKQEILQAAYMQEFENGNQEKRLNGVYEYSKSPIISSSYSHLAETFGTNYFSVQGINLHKKPRTGNLLMLVLFPPLGIYKLGHLETDLYYYNIVADLSKGEIVHKELRKVAQSVNKSTINTMMYDSYKLLKK